MEAAAAAAAAAVAAVPVEHREWVERLRHGGSTPLSQSQSQSQTSNSWAFPPCHVFSVRGSDYLKTTSKIPASDCLLQPLAFDFLQGPCQISHIIHHPHSRVRAALDAATRDHPSSTQHHQPFVWAFNFQLGIKTHHSIVFYFVSFSNPPPGSLMQRFLDGDDAFRNARLKLLTRFPEAPWLVQVVLGERWPVCMVGKIMKCSYTREKHYIEVDVDAGSSMLTRTAVNLTFGLAPLVVADMAFVLEGVHPDELPERILGAMRLVKLEPSSATHMDMSEVNDVINHKSTAGEQNGIKAKFMKLSKSSSKDLRSGLKYKRNASGDKEDKGGAQIIG